MKARSRCAPTPSVQGKAAASVAVDGFALPGSRSLGCLLVHGFTATPDEMRPLVRCYSLSDRPRDDYYRITVKCVPRDEGEGGDGRRGLSGSHYFHRDVNVGSTLAIEAPEEIVSRVRAAEAVVGRGRVHLNPDCGFGTFAERPVASMETARRKLASLATAARRLRA